MQMVLRESIVLWHWGLLLLLLMLLLHVGWLRRIHEGMRWGRHWQGSLLGSGSGKVWERKRWCQHT